MAEIRIPPAEGTLRGPWNDWLGRGPKTRRDHVWLHGGLDIFNHGRPVVAPENGRVLVALAKVPKEKSIFGGYGPAVVVIYGDSGTFHWLAHLKRPTVKWRDFVTAGQVVAEATTDHVHWETRQDFSAYKGAKYWPWTITIDPYRWLLFRELTALDAIDYAKSYLPGDDWKDSRKRMELLRQKVKPDQKRKSAYPIPLRWTTATKRSILEETTRIKRKRTQKQTVAIAAGAFAGLAVLTAAFL